MTLSTTPAMTVTQTAGTTHVLMYLLSFTQSQTPAMQVQITGQLQTVNMQPSG